MADMEGQATETFGRLQALYDAEIAADAVPRTRDDVPLSYERIGDDWLTAALCDGVAGAAVVGHDFLGPDDGTTNRRRLIVRYNQAGADAGLPERIFCKASFGLQNRFILGPSGAIEAEVGFYTRVRPHLRIEATDGVFAVMNEAFNSLILLRDITDRVAEFCDHRTVITRTRAESQVRTLAALHAAGVAEPAIVEARPVFRTWAQFFHGTKAFGLDVGAKAGFAAASDLIPSRTYAREGEVWEATETAVERSTRRPSTMTHGDVHLKNWYVADHGGMGLSDWQCANVGHWGRDLAYTLGTALNVEDRRAWERDLIGLYLEELGRLGGDVLPFDQAFDVYREQMLPALAWWTITLNPAPGMPDMQPRDVTVEFVRRLGTAIDDLDSLDA